MRALLEESWKLSLFGQRNLPDVSPLLVLWRGIYCAQRSEKRLPDLRDQQCISALCRSKRRGQINTGLESPVTWRAPDTIFHVCSRQNCVLGMFT